MDLGELTLEKAKPFEGMTFEATLADGNTVTLKLDEALPFELNARRRIRGGVPQKREPFSLYFLGAPGEVLPQGMYTLRSGDVTFENIFLVPVGQDDEATEYEAVFN